MAKTFRPWDVTQRWLLPPSVDELVPRGHIAHFIRETVREELDLSGLMADYEEERGFPPFHPAMMTALLLFAYCQGVYSSRRIAKGCIERVDFMAVTGRNQPDFRTIAKFRKRHLQPLAGLFAQVLRLCQRAGLVKLGHVALDGTKIKANASKRKAMSYRRMKDTEEKLALEVQSWLERADQLDAEEDAEHGPDRMGDELPDWVVNKELRRQRIAEARAALEAEAATDPDDDPPPSGGGAHPEGPGPVERKLRDQAQRNFTDPDSKILKAADRFIQGYNCQAAVDSEAQVIVAHDVVAQQNDAPQLVPMVDQIIRNTRRRPAEISADNGYCSEGNLRALQRRKIRGYIATGKERHHRPTLSRPRALRGRLTRRMRLRLDRAGFRSRYRLRKQIVEPVFGQIKVGRQFSTLLLRGLDSVRGEWALVCTAHNLLKLARR